MTPRRRENMTYPFNNPDSPPPSGPSGAHTPVPTMSPFVRLGVGTTPVAPAGEHRSGRRSEGFLSPPPGLEKSGKFIERHFIGSPSNSHEPSSSSQTPSRSAVHVTPPRHPEFASAAQTTPSPPTRIDHPPPQVVFQGDPMAWYAVLQAQWQVCDAYRLEGPVGT